MSYSKVVGGLTLAGNTLYGSITTTIEGNGQYQTFSGLFAVNTDGTGFTNLYGFTPLSGTGTNSDGFNPNCLISSSNTLYGKAETGGSSGRGTVFRLNTDGTGFTKLLDFGATELVLTGNTLYGTTTIHDTITFNNYGTVFKVNTDGTSFTTLANEEWSTPLHDFNASWLGKLVLSGDTLYWTFNSFNSARLTVSSILLAVNTDGTGFTNVWQSRVPFGLEIDDFILSGNTLYGTSGGGSGPVFSLSFTPQLTIIFSAANIVLAWPTNYAGFDYTGYTLQSTTNLGSSAIWTTNSPTPVVVEGLNTVTNPISGTQHFFRLSQ